jgi:hypothetical protein
MFDPTVTQGSRVKRTCALIMIPGSADDGNRHLGFGSGVIANRAFITPKVF